MLATGSPTMPRRDMCSRRRSRGRRSAAEDLIHDDHDLRHVRRGGGPDNTIVNDGLPVRQHIAQADDSMRVRNQRGGFGIERVLLAHDLHDLTLGGIGTAGTGNEVGEPSKPGRPRGIERHSVMMRHTR